MKLLKSIIFAASASSVAGLHPVAMRAMGDLCAPCPEDGKGCDSDLWMECSTDGRNICVCKPRWFHDGEHGCMGQANDVNMNHKDQCKIDPVDPTTDPDATTTDLETTTKKIPIENEAVLCGKCNSVGGCGSKSDYMYCHSEVRVCVCQKGWGPNADSTSCSMESDMEFTLDQCKDIKPDVIDEICPADMCGENEKCKMVQVGDKFHPKCICMAGFEYDAATNMCVGETVGKCLRNTDCNMEGFERCDKDDTKRCVCRDGYMLGKDADGNMVCMATCGKYQTIDAADIYEVDADYPTKPMIPDYIMKYMKPQICDPNATCMEKDVYGMMMQACVCNQGYSGDGCTCDNKDTCDELCDRKMPGSICHKNPNGSEFRCDCPKGTEHLQYNDGTPCCVAPPSCENSEDCEMMGSAWCLLDDVAGTGACQCKDPLRMNKKRMCVGKDDHDEDDYEDEVDEDDIKDPCHGIKCERNAHCVADSTREPKCVCDKGYNGRDGANCIMEVDEVLCRFGTCHGSMRMTMKPDFESEPGDKCGVDKMNLMCMESGCCECAKHYTDANNKRNDGCENRISPCNTQEICHKNADCIDLESIKNDYEIKPKHSWWFEIKPWVFTGFTHGYVDYRMDMMDEKEDEKPIAIKELGFQCVCRAPLVGSGIGGQGCGKPEELQVNECMSLINPCGRNSDCTDQRDGFECKCHEGFKSDSRDGKNCVKPVTVIDPTDTDKCDGFCEYTKLTKGDCHLRDISSLHNKVTDYMVMDGDATDNMLPGVMMKVSTKRVGWPLNRASYTAFLEFDQAKCGNVLLGGMMSGNVKVAVFDRAGSDGSSVYRVDGVMGYLTKTVSNSRTWSGLVVQFSKKFATLSEQTGNPDDMELNQEMRELKDGSFKMKPDYDTFYLSLVGKEVSKQAMGDKFKECFDVRDSSPFDFILWDERSEAQETDLVDDREKLVPLNGDYTKCYLHNKIKDKGIKDIVCKEPLVVDGEKTKDNPTFAEMVATGDKDSMACTEQD